VRHDSIEKYRSRSGSGTFAASLRDAISNPFVERERPLVVITL